jgi:hypothetical protein
MGDHWAAKRIVGSEGSATFHDKLGMFSLAAASVYLYIPG